MLPRIDAHNDKSVGALVQSIWPIDLVSCAKSWKACCSSLFMIHIHFFIYFSFLEIVDENGTIFFFLILMWPNLKPDLGSSQNFIHMPPQQKSDFAFVCLFLLSNALFVCACVFSTRIEITQPEASFKLERDFTRKKIGTFASRSSFCSFVTTSSCFLFNFWRETFFFF